MMRIAGLAVAFLLAFGSTALAADTLRVLGAGSLTNAFTDLLKRFPADPDTIATPEFGPSGLLRQKIEQGAEADLFASADMAHPRILAAGRPERTVLHFARNELCALAKPDLGLTTEGLLERLLDPAVRIATSTPGADPSGDYTWAMFDRAEVVKPGARATLQGKAQKLVGGGAATPPLVPGKGAAAGVFLADRADVLIGYCSGTAGVVAEVPGLTVARLPPELAVAAQYGMVLLTRKPVALRFAAFVMSEAGQATLRQHGLLPATWAESTDGTLGLVVQRKGQAAQFVSTEAIAGLKQLAQTVVFTTGRGQQGGEWRGPLLWDLLVAAGLVDDAQPAGHVRLVVRVSGADGYVAAFAGGELSPQFGGRPIQLASQLDGKPVANGPLRLIVPGERRAGRSVREVVRIDVE